MAMLTDHTPKQNRSGRRQHSHHSGRSDRAQSENGASSNKIAGRVGEIARQVAEMAAADRLAIRLAEHRRRRQLLTEQGCTDDEIDRIEDLRLGASYHVLCAMGQCSRLWIDDGMLHVEGSRAGHFVKRLSRYNRVPDGRKCSLAAVVYQRLTGGGA
ncbi:hypothetical protein [Novipirellula caenicola]|uniref:Uncharacterized protein n=1 Tax=Novipirellula caenicola TaxID=1536901 RepID=A0ABP9VWK3_9BACT